MRIISGIYGGRKLFPKLPNSVRPTTDSNKESIFNILTNHIDFEGKTILDLFAGSGSLGIESLSRGASNCTFVENDFNVINSLSESLISLGTIKNKFELIKKDALSYTKSCKSSFDLIFSDAPYNLKVSNQILNEIINNNLLNKDGLIMLEYGINEMVLPQKSYKTINQKKLGETQFSIFLNC
ncbi:MAG: 16S rRNA (guanine(966)-N(2))-methyltransferase RsmD [Candidatus Kapabacteria bacterium]|nr:16S rRNA (guanine(966)-N(2))-methyltransferase RsmD [Candidatus Kapabacteria bacterium]